MDSPSATATFRIAELEKEQQNALRVGLRLTGTTSVHSDSESLAPHFITVVAQRLGTGLECNFSITHDEPHDTQLETESPEPVIRVSLILFPSPNLPEPNSWELNHNSMQFAPDISGFPPGIQLENPFLTIDSLVVLTDCAKTAADKLAPPALESVSSQEKRMKAAFLGQESPLDRGVVPGEELFSYQRRGGQLDDLRSSGRRRHPNRADEGRHGDPRE